MDNGPVIQHWLATVVRSAGLEGADDISLVSDADTPSAWDVVTMALGISHQELAEEVARHFGLDVADFDDVDPHAVKLIPRRVAERLGVFPLQYSDRRLVVASGDPVSMDAEKEVAHLTARNPEFRVAPPATVHEAIEASYPTEPTERHELPAILAEDVESPHILVVDDDPDIRLLLRTALEKKGFRVTEAPDGPEALEVLKSSEAVSLVTLDLMMDKMHGLDVLKAMRARVRHAATPVIVATGADDPEVEMELFEAGADDFVVKPLDPARFLLRVQAVLRRHGFGQPAIRL